MSRPQTQLGIPLPPLKSSSWSPPEHVPAASTLTIKSTNITDGNMVLSWHHVGNASSLCLSLPRHER